MPGLQGPPNKRALFTHAGAMSVAQRCLHLRHGTCKQ